MEKIIIYGAGKLGSVAYEYFSDHSEILFFCDKDESKWGKYKNGIKICPPELLKNHRDTKIVIASAFYREILQELAYLKLENTSVFGVEVNSCLSVNISSHLDKQTIDLGAFLYNQDNIFCKELTFLPGGSNVLDYVFIKKIAEVIQAKGYLEIGTYIGESINILSDTCDVLHSVTAPLDAPFSMRNWCKMASIPDYSGRLSYSSKIIHHYGDSKAFDFSTIAAEIDLYFIDGDHSYQGVYTDTNNIFAAKKEDAVVIWHDFKILRNQYNSEVIKAVKDALGDKFDNVYVTNGNICGIYLPPKYQSLFMLRERKFEESAPLYTYDLSLKNSKKWE